MTEYWGDPEVDRVIGSGRSDTVFSAIHVIGCCVGGIITGGGWWWFFACVFAWVGFLSFLYWYSDGERRTDTEVANLLRHDRKYLSPSHLSKQDKLQTIRRAEERKGRNRRRREKYQTKNRKGAK